MPGLGRIVLSMVGLLALTGTGACAQAGAPANIDAGKNAQQLYAADCAECHKSPQGLAKGGPAFGLSSFLRQHYTASRESADALAAYLANLDRGAPAPARAGKPKPKVKPEDAKTGEGKPGDSKPAEAKPATSTQSAEKPAESKPAEAKPAASTPSETKPADAPKSE